MRTRVLYIDVSQKFGGTIVSLLSRIKHMNRGQFEPLVLCRRGLQCDAFRRLGVEIQAISAPSFSRSSFEIAGIRLYNPIPVVNHLLILTAVFVATCRFIRNGGVDIIHGSALYANLYASILGLIFRKPVIWHINDFTVTFDKKLHRFLSRRAVRMVAISEAIRNYLVHSGVEEKKVVQIYQPIDFEEYSPIDKIEARNRLGLARGKDIIGFIGRLDPDKGVDQFLLIASKVMQSHPDALFVLAGKGANKRYLATIRRTIERLDLRKNLLFMGLRRDIPVLMNALDVLVFSATAPEPFGRVLAEASACGTPIVAADVGAVREIVKHDETGIVVPLGEVDLSADRVSYLLRDHDRAERMRCAARERVIALFSPDLHMRKLERMYEEVLDG